MAAHYVALVPEPVAPADRPEPRLRDRLAGLAGLHRPVFAALPVDPARLAGVLLLTPGRPGTVTVNGRPATALSGCPGRLLLDPSPFRRHENHLCLSRGAGEALLAPVADSRTLRDMDLPSGRIWRMRTLDGEDLGPAPRPAAAPIPDDGALAGLARGLAAMLDENGDVWSFYDLAEGTFRLSGWRWDTGIVLEALAAAAQVLPEDALLQAARIVGDRLLACRLDHPQCPGGFPEWTDLRYFASPRRASQWVAPFNAAFIAAGLVRLAGLTGEPAYRQAARDSLHLAASTGLTPDGGVRGYYFEDDRRWRYLGQINDSGILGRGLALFPDDGPWTAEAAARSATYILGKAAQPDGHIGRAWWEPARAFPPGDPLFPEWRRHPGRLVAKIFLRGQAWVLLGLAGAVRLGADEAITTGGRRLVHFILDAQQPDGSWLYSQRQPHLGACAKTTAALALALAEWAAATDSPEGRPAAARALAYLEGCRRPGEVPAALSGLPVDVSAEGCIIYFRDRPVVCAYAGALELLARLAMGEAP